MSVRVWIILVIAAALVLGVMSPYAWGQNGQPVTVQLQAPQRMYLGDNQDIQIVVSGSRNVPAPDMSGVTDFEVVYRAPQDMTSTNTVIMNGRVSTTVNIVVGHLYSITPRRAGQLEIPAITVVVDGKNYTTPATIVEVVEPKQGDGFALALTADHSRAYVGQPVLVKLVWTLGKNVTAVQLSMPIDGAEHEEMPGPQTRPLNGNTPGAVVVGLNGVQAIGAFDQHSLTIDKIIVPKHAGKITIGPARADYQTVVGQRQRGPMDFPFGNRDITERQFSSAAPIEILVDDLPTAGRPKDFSGLVGKYEITASADSTNVSVGEPINLMVGVAGPYPPSLIPPLDFGAHGALKNHFRVPREPVLGQTTPTAAIFNAMIRAKNDGVEAIDPVSINFFDPDAKQYRTASTAAIPLTVKASTTVGLPDEPETPEPNHPAQSARPGGLPDIYRGTAAGGATTVDVREAMRSNATMVLLAAPPAVCGAVVAGMGFSRWRRRDPEGARRAAAVRKLRKAIKQPTKGATPIDSTARALANFAADWFSHPADTLTGPMAAELLQAEGTDAGRTLAGLIAECDAARFSGARMETDAKAIGERAIAASKRFGNELLATPRGRAA
jgi:hypothetical protein